MNEWSRIVLHDDRRPQLNPSIAGFLEKELVVTLKITFGKKKFYVELLLSGVFLVLLWPKVVLGRIHLHL